LHYVRKLSYKVEFFCALALEKKIFKDFPKINTSKMFPLIVASLGAITSTILNLHYVR
jgi:hypothetical protein